MEFTQLGWAAWIAGRIEGCRRASMGCTNESMGQEDGSGEGRRGFRGTIGVLDAIALADGDGEGAFDVLSS